MTNITTDNAVLNNLFLHSACIGDLKNFKINVECGADIYIEEHKPLKWSLVFSHFHIAEYLYEHYDDKQLFFSICAENNSPVVQYWLNAKILLEKLDNQLNIKIHETKKTKI